MVGGINFLKPISIMIKAIVCFIGAFIAHSVLSYFILPHIRAKSPFRTRSTRSLFDANSIFAISENWWQLLPGNFTVSFTDSVLGQEGLGSDNPNNRAYGPNNFGIYTSIESI